MKQYLRKMRRLILIHTQDGSNRLFMLFQQGILQKSFTSELQIQVTFSNFVYLSIGLTDLSQQLQVIILVSVNEKQPSGGLKEKGDEDLDGLLHTLPVSYYRVGSIHTFGSQANYRSERLDAARYATGDIVSVWVDSFPKGSPPFSVSVSCPAPTSRLNPNAASCDRIPFCALFKNGP